MTALARTMLREQVKEVLLERIATGELQPGERIVETRLAQELGTSQAPVREALRELELMRLVDSEPYRGARVRQFGDDELVEVQPVRAALEEVAARQAAERLGGDVSALEAELGAMRDAAARGDVQSLCRHDFAFHRAIVDAARLPILTQCWQLLGMEGPITLTLYQADVSPEQAAEVHVPLLEAIRAGDGEAAAREARAHVEWFARLARRNAGRAGAEPQRAG